MANEKLNYSVTLVLQTREKVKSLSVNLQVEWRGSMWRCTDENSEECVGFGASPEVAIVDHLKTRVNVKGIQDQVSGV